MRIAADEKSDAQREFERGLLEVMPSLRRFRLSALSGRICCRTRWRALGRSGQSLIRPGVRLAAG